MSEAMFVNLFTVLRVLLVGGAFIILPLITRKGLLFGAYVGEEFAELEAARGLRRRWYLGCVVLMVSSLAVGLGISLAGRPVAGNLICTAVLLLGGLALYLRAYQSARRMAPPAASSQADLAAAPLEGGEPKGATLAKLALGITILVGLATVIYAIVSYRALPERVPIHFDSAGEADRWTDKSFLSIMLVPSLNLLIAPFYALMAWLTTSAKRSVRGGSGGRSAEAQLAFRAAMANLFSWMSLWFCLLMTFYSVQRIRLGLSEIRSLGVGVLSICVAMLLYILVALVRILSKHGQGGARVEQGSSEAPLTNGLADNARWVWGVLYVHRDDPSILVEKRVGIGYTINFGNRTAVAIVVTFVALILGLVALALIL